MFRITSLAVLIALTIGSGAALAGPLDGDNNPVPAASTRQHGSALERAYAGLNRPMPTVRENAAYFDRHTQVD